MRLTGNGVYPVLEINGSHGRATVALFGAQVLSWKPYGGDETLWLNPGAYPRGLTAVRGGIPICFPWFGEAGSGDGRPKHGIAQMNVWELVDTSSTSNSVTVILKLPQPALRAAEIPTGVSVFYRIALGHTLSLSLDVENAGRDEFCFEALLHPYYAVEDADEARLLTSAGHDLIPPRGGQTALSVSTEGPLEARLLRGSNLLAIAMRSQSPDLVLWNPGEDVPADIENEERSRFLCVEPGAIGTNAIRLAPGHRHSTQLELGTDSGSRIAFPSSSSQGKNHA